LHIYAKVNKILTKFTFVDQYGCLNLYSEGSRLKYELFFLVLLVALLIKNKNILELIVKFWVNNK